MSLRKNLFDFDKVRKGSISRDFKKLVVQFGFKFLPYEEGLIETDKIYSYSISKPAGKLDFKFEENGDFFLDITLDSEDLNYLYLVGHILAFMFGMNFEISYHHRDFPYAPIVRYLNLNSSSQLITKLYFQDFLKDPVATLDRFIVLFQKEGSLFNQLAPALLQVNAFSFPDVSFIVEYGLLEYVSRKENVYGILFKKYTKEYAELELFVAKINDLIKSYPSINVAPLRDKFDILKLNDRGVAKEKIKKFLGNFSVPISRYIGQVDEFAELRNKLIVHGSTPEGVVKIQQQGSVGIYLHELMLDLLQFEYQNSR